MTDARIKIAQVPLAQAYASLRSTAAGLGGFEAARRVGEFGPNRIEERPRAHWLASLAGEFANFFALILWLAAALALVAEWRDPDQGMALLAAAIVGVVFIKGIAIGRYSIRSCNPASTTIETSITSASAEKIHRSDLAARSTAEDP